jgi:7-keto-8-aminopelargonate synthetase-like enzyme
MLSHNERTSLSYFSCRYIGLKRTQELHNVASSAIQQYNWSLKSMAQTVGAENSTELAFLPL